MSLTVNQATPTITWATPAAITYGTALSATQLNASSTVAGTLPIRRPPGTVLTAGAYPLCHLDPDRHHRLHDGHHTVSIDGEPGYAVHHLGDACGHHLRHGAERHAAECQFDGSRNFTYTPASGTVLTAGPHTLSVTLTPTDATDYKTATATVSLTVNKATPTITWTAQRPSPTARR